MRSIVVDTNVVLSFVTDRNATQQRAAERLFERAASGAVRTILLQAVLIEIVYVLQNLYKVSPAEIAGLVDDLLAMPNVGVENELPWQEVLDVWPGPIRDLADAVLVTVARLGGHELASFDRKLARALRRHGVSAYPLR